MNQKFYMFVGFGAVLALSVSASSQSLPSSLEKNDYRPAPGGAITYQFENSGRGSYQGRNTEQRLTLEFTPQEARLQNPRASASLHLTGYGYGRRLRTPIEAKLAGAGNRLEYQRGELTEWYVNQPDGLEQGFTFARRPAGAGNGEPLVIALTVAGGLAPMLASDGEAVLLQSEGHEVLRYGGLRTWDARGREVASRLEVREREIRLIVDDADAEYPLVVDPSVTALTASWTNMPNAATLGDLVTLTATVTAVTGKVTFYDGTAVLGVASVTGGGTATFATTLLLAGGNCLGSVFFFPLPCAHSLAARYDGDATLFPLTPAFVVVSNPATTLGPPKSFPVGTNAEAIALGNFNLPKPPGDRNADLAIANLGGGVSVLLGDGTGMFTNALLSPFSAGSGPRAVAVGDFNGDGLPDLAVVDYSSGVSILLGLGNAGFGGFGPPTHFGTGSFPQGVTVGDFNGDGNADLAITNNGDNTVTVLLGDGTGNFMEQFFSPYTVGLGPAGIAVGDFNGDGFADLAIVNDFDSTVRILQGDGAGNFTLLPGSTMVGRSANGGQTIAAGDFNLDKKVDLAVTTNFGVSILLGNGNGTFTVTAGSPVPADVYPDAVAVADFDGDGNPDLAVVNGFSDDVSILLGNGDGTFQPPANFGVGFLPSSLAVGEFNGDGITDVAVTDFDSDVIVLTGKNMKLTVSASSSPQSTQVNTAFASPLIVTTTPPTKGVVVTFTPPSSGPSGSFAGGVNTAVTDATGTATSATFTANSKAGTYFVIAKAGFGAKATFTMTNRGIRSIATVGGSPQKTNVNTAFPSPLQAKVTDENGIGIPMVAVMFVAPSGLGAPSGTFSGGLTTITVLTDASGVAAPTFTANGTVGSYGVVATSASVPGAAFFALTNTGSSASIVTVGGTPQSTGLGSPFPVALTAKVTDGPLGSGSPVPGATVTFTVNPASGAGGSFTTGATFFGSTDGAGLLTAPTLTANGTAGTFTVTASVPISVSPFVATTTFTLTNAGGGLNLPGDQTLGLNDSVSFLIRLGSPAPAGGIIVTLTSDNTSVAQIIPQYIRIPEGSTTSLGMARLIAQGVAGSATIAASAPTYGLPLVSFKVTVK